MKPLALILLTAAAFFAQSKTEIRGYAWNAEGRPIADAQVTFTPEGSQAGQTITAGKDGAFVAHDVKPGRYIVTANAPKEQLQTESTTTIEVKPGETLHTDLTLGMSTVHHGYWSRLVRRLDGLH